MVLLLTVRLHVLVRKVTELLMERFEGGHFIPDHDFSPVLVRGSHFCHRKVEDRPIEIRRT